jgi:glycosyltransferase involved in cell wall biosynthesis
MACGAPAVGTRVASIPEIIEDGVSGYLVEQHDIDGLTRALTTLAADRTLADRMGKAARQCVLDRFSWPSVVSACLDAYAA